MTRANILLLALVVGLVLAGSGVAAGQTLSASSGPLVLTPIANDIVFSPDVKVTTVNDQMATLVGAYIGRLWDGRLLLGGGAYWLADSRQDARLGYAGILTGWKLIDTRRFGLEGRLLAGAGQGTIYRVVQTVARFDDGRGDGRIGAPADIWIAEPQVVGQFAVTDALRLTAGVGYRATTGVNRGRSVFSGATGSIGVQFDLGN